MTDWKGITHAGEIDRLIKDHGVFSGKPAGVENTAVSVALRFALEELFDLATVRGFITAKCLMSVSGA